MSQHLDLTLVLAALNEAALDDSKWPACAIQIDQACGTVGSCVTYSPIGSAERESVFFVRICIRGERRRDLEREYFENYYALDEAALRFRSLPDGELVHVPDLYTNAERETSRTYNSFLVANDLQNSVHMQLTYPEGSRVTFTLLRPGVERGPNLFRIQAIKSLLPHIARFAHLRQALFDARASRESLTELLDNTRIGIIQLDWRFRIVQINDCARTILQKNDGLHEENGFLRARRPEDNYNLQRLLERALPQLGKPGVSGSIALGRTSVAPRFLLNVIPTSGEHTNFQFARMGVSIVIVDPVIRATIDPEVVAAALGLTPSESQIACLLAAGNSIRDIAHSTGREENTIRWHIRRIFNKQSITRQTELIRRVLELAGYRL